MPFDWRQTGNQVWNVRLVLDHGELIVNDGGASLSLNGEQLQIIEKNEYEAIHRRFVEIVAGGICGLSESDNEDPDLLEKRRFDLNLGHACESLRVLEINHSLGFCHFKL